MHNCENKKEEGKKLDKTFLQNTSKNMHVTAPLIQYSTPNRVENNLQVPPVAPWGLQGSGQTTTTTTQHSTVHTWGMPFEFIMASL